MAVGRGGVRGGDHEGERERERDERAGREVAERGEGE